MIQKRMATCWERLSKAFASVQSSYELLKEHYSQIYIWGLQPEWNLLFSHITICCCTTANVVSAIGLHLQESTEGLEQSFVLSATRLRNEYTVELYLTYCLSASFQQHRYRSLLTVYVRMLLNVLNVFSCVSLSLWTMYWQCFVLCTVVCQVWRLHEIITAVSSVQCTVAFPKLIYIAILSHFVIDPTIYKKEVFLTVIAYKVSGKTQINMNVKVGTNNTMTHKHDHFQLDPKKCMSISGLCWSGS